MGFPVERFDLELPEPQSLDSAEVAEVKARAAYERLRRPVLVEDSGLEVLAWGGFPGALVKWLERTAGLEGFVRMLDSFPDRRARAVCALSCFDGEILVSALGVTAGSIAIEPRGSGGFGWDPIFVPEGFDETYAELAPPQKDRVSHRGRAWRDLAGKFPE